MNNIDRFIRVIYTEANLLDLLICDKNREKESGSAGLEGVVENASWFWLENSSKSKPSSCYASSDCASARSRNYVIAAYMKEYSKNYSEDEVGLLLREQLSKTESFGLYSGNAIALIQRAAKEVLQIKSGRLVAKSGLLMEWHGLMNRVDPNVFIAAFDASWQPQDTQGHIYVGYDDDRLRSILDRGYAENHAHLKGSGYSPDINWYCFLRMSQYRMAGFHKALDDFVRTRWPEASENEIAQRELAFLKLPLLRNILYAYANYALNDRSKYSSSDCEPPDQNPSDTIDFNKMLSCLLRARDEVELSQVRSSLEYEEIAIYGDLDLEKRVFQDPADYCLNEQKFLRSMFKVLNRSLVDPLILYAFNVYIAGITQFKLGMIHDNLLMGFSQFSHAESQKKAFIDYVHGAEDALFRSVFDRYYRNGNVQYVELRIAPTTRSGFSKYVKRLDKANADMFDLHKQQDSTVRLINYGLIIHFIKDGKNIDLRSYVARKEGLAEKTWRDFSKIRYIIEGVGRGFSKQLVAIDAANFERNTPPETYGTIFRLYKNEMASKGKDGRTFHVGEDFNTLCSGLRVIDEAIRYLELSRGDRLGHASALGLMPSRYFLRKRKYLTLTLEEHVDNLAWMWGVISEKQPGRTDLIQFLNRQFDDYAATLFSSIDFSSIGVPSIAEYWWAYLLRGDDPRLYLSDHDFGRMATLYPFLFSSDAEESHARAVKRACKIVEAYHFDARLKRIGQSPLIIHAEDSYIQSVALAQSLLRKKIHDKGISIETNPTSNKKISSVEHYVEIPLLRMNHQYLRSGINLQEDPENPNLLATINSDDSGVFQTDLAMEYALMVEALRRAGCEDSDIYDYIEILRENSLIQSFVYNAKSDVADFV